MCRKSRPSSLSRSSIRHIQESSTAGDLLHADGRYTRPVLRRQAAPPGQSRGPRRSCRPDCSTARPPRPRRPRSPQQGADAVGRLKVLVPYAVADFFHLHHRHGAELGDKVLEQRRSGGGAQLLPNGPAIDGTSRRMWAVAGRARAGCRGRSAPGRFPRAPGRPRYAPHPACAPAGRPPPRRPPRQAAHLMEVDLLHRRAVGVAFSLRDQALDRSSSSPPPPSNATHTAQRGASIPPVVVVMSMVVVMLVVLRVHGHVRARDHAHGCGCGHGRGRDGGCALPGIRRS